MSLGLLGKKLGMTRLFDEQARSMIPVTVIDVSGNTILQTKTPEKDGYSAVQIGYDDQKEQRVVKAALGRFKKAGSTPKRFIKEFRFAEGAAA
jgi:large subunit ribosomal protein L3